MDLRYLRERFCCEKQLCAVRDIIQSRLADDRNQNECRYLMRFWWQLSMGYQEVTLQELEQNIAGEKLEIILKLLSALGKDYQAIDNWIEYHSNALEIIQDRGFTQIL
jgi:hypothetical protein